MLISYFMLSNYNNKLYIRLLFLAIKLTKHHKKLTSTVNIVCREYSFWGKYENN